MPGNDYLGSLERQRGVRERTRENGARLARAYGTHVTTGWGEILVPDPILFGATFFGPPAVTSGVVVEARGGVRDDDNPLLTGRFPRVTCGVWNWVQDVNDHYTGAYVFFVVETMGFQQAGGSYPTSADPGYTLTHHLLFEGISYKDFNPARLDY